MITTKEIEEAVTNGWLENVDNVEGFHRREDNTIERLIDGNSGGADGPVITGEYYDKVEIISENSYLEFCNDDIQSEITNKVNAADEEADN